MNETQDQKSSSLFTSAVLHGLLFAGLFYILSLEPKEGGKSEPIQIETIQAKKTIKEPTTHFKAAEKSQAVSLNDLGMRLSHEPFHEAPEPLGGNTNQGASDESPAERNDGWDIMNPDPKIARFNRYIYTTVQGWLDRDAYLNIEKMYGTVKVLIWFDENGNYLENETVYDAIDPNFQRVVAKALQKSFAVPVPRPFLYLHHKFSIERVVVIRQS